MTPNESIALLKACLEFSVIQKKGKQKHPYFVDRVTTGVYIQPQLLRNLAIALLNKISCSFTQIVTIESMGIPIGVMLSLLTDTPLTVIRKKRLLPADKKVKRETGYLKDVLYIPEILNGERVFLVDNVIDTGGTFRVLQDILHPVCSAVLVKNVHAQLPLAVSSLVDYDIQDDEVIVCP